MALNWQYFCESAIRFRVYILFTSCSFCMETNSKQNKVGWEKVHNFMTHTQPYFLIFIEHAQNTYKKLKRKFLVEQIVKREARAINSIYMSVRKHNVSSRTEVHPNRNFLSLSFSLSFDSPATKNSYETVYQLF